MIYYFNNATFDDYPVVGVTQEQANQYSIWRTNRVLEMMQFINQRGKINNKAAKVSKYKNNRNFSVENYYLKKTDYFQDNNQLEYYVEYSLPDINDRNLALKYADSIKFILKDKLSKHVNYLDHYGINPCKNDTLSVIPTFSLHKSTHPMLNKYIPHLRSQVREWSSYKNAIFNGCWKDEKSNSYHNDTIHVIGSDVFTGFRCVARWKKFNHNTHH